jgi:predicted  nucleic acid-binding Zn-ribbon protein
MFDFSFRNKSLKDENNRLNDLHLGMQQQLSDLLTQKSSMASELELLKQQVKKLTLSGTHSAETSMEIEQLNVIFHY